MPRLQPMRISGDKSNCCAIQTLYDNRYSNFKHSNPKPDPLSVELLACEAQIRICDLPENYHILLKV